MLEEVYENAQRRMDASIESLRRELVTVRTGRASVAMLDEVRVDCYGQQSPLNQVANVSVPEASLLVVQPFDPSQLQLIEKGILKANLGLTPANDGKVIRVPIPPLTEERRRELAKKVRDTGEEIRTAIRNVRRDANDDVRALEKDKSLSQDDAKKALKQVQDITDGAVGRVDEMVKTKEQEVLSL